MSDTLPDSPDVDELPDYDRPHLFEEGPALSCCGLCDRPLSDPIHDADWWDD